MHRVSCCYQTGTGRELSASGQPVECGFLILCRKDFTTRVQVILRVCLLRLGTVTKERLGVEVVTGESAGEALLRLPRNAIEERSEPRQGSC